MGIGFSEMILRQREPRREDPKHLAFVRKLPCCVCGSMRDIEAAHIRLACPAIGKRETGMAEKPDDRFVTPLCHYHHQSSILAQHRVGERRFWFEIHGRNPFQVAAVLWEMSGGAARALEPKPANRRQNIKPPSRSESKLQIQSRPTFPQGRKLQSRGFRSIRPMERQR
jgi:hypothetical protein